MCNFREKWEINLENCHALCWFESWLFTVSVKLNPFWCHSIITWTAGGKLQHSFCLLNEKPGLHLSFDMDTSKTISRKFHRLCIKSFGNLAKDLFFEDSVRPAKHFHMGWNVEGTSKSSISYFEACFQVIDIFHTNPVIAFNNKQRNTSPTLLLLFLHLLSPNHHHHHHHHHHHLK